MKKIICLQKIGKIDQIVLTKLKKNLEWSFKEYDLHFKVLPDKMPLLDAEYHVIRRQYDASKIMKRLLKLVIKEDYFRILGIINEDIFTGFLNFVFGIANMPTDGYFGSAIISITRLSENFYRRQEDLALFELRVLKEAIHELGHTFGLQHCHNFCIMQFSNCLEDTDKKPPNFCDSCSQKISIFFKNLN